MNSKLCCVLSSRFKCGVCDRKWCDTCWGAGLTQGTHYTMREEDITGLSHYIKGFKERCKRVGRKLCEEGDNL